jgi:WD40 repeat protein/tetratricopeptide (TPR) repeat protein
MSSNPPTVTWSNLLPELGRVSGAGLLRLLCAEQQRCWQRGQRCLAEDYRRKVPPLQQDDTLFLDLVWNEVLLREGLGETPSAAEYAQRFPQFAAELHRRFALRAEFTQPLATAPAAGPAPSGATPAEPPQQQTAPLTEPAGRLRVAGYEVLGVLGEGGMGVVYRARHRELGHEVALKMILGGGQAGGEYLARFHLEAAAVARLQHPGIVHLYEFGAHEGRPFFSLELVEGGSLAGKLKDGPLPPRQAAALVEKLARAMQHAHDHGIIHRDLKPANVLLTKEGEPKITDFGLAKQLGSDDGLSVSGAIMGTPSYMAPEQAEGRLRDLGPATDAYALGAILYECLTGRPPFRGGTAQETLNLVVRQEPTRPRHWVPGVPRDLETVCLRCLEKEARKRYATAADLADDLKRYLDGEPVRARPVRNWERAWKWARRRPALAALAGVSAVAALALVWLLVDLSYNTSLQAALLDAREQRARAEAQETLAERGRDEADRQRRRAEAERAEADKQRQFAEKQHQLAQQQRALAQRLRYAADLNLAQQAFRDNRLFRMRELLQTYETADDLKGFEWESLWRLCRTKLVLGPRHQKAARAVAFSPDGRRAVSGGVDGAVKIWDTGTGAELLSLAGHPRTVNAVAFSPAGNTVASAGTDGTVKVWDSTTGRELYTVADARGSINGLALSPDGRRLALAGDGKLVIVCDAVTGKQQGRWAGHGADVTALAFGPDSKRLASGSADGVVKLWDVEAGKAVQTLTGHKKSILAVAFGPDGKRLASSSEDTNSLVIVWDPAAGKEVHRYTDSALPVTGLAFSPDGRRLAAVSADGTARLREVEADKPPTVLYGPGGLLFGGTFSPDGTRLAFGGDDGSVQVWDLTVEDDDALLSGWVIKEPGLFLAQSPDGRWLAVGAEGAVNLWDPLSRQKVRTFQGATGIVQGVAFSPDGRWLVAGGEDKVARVYQVADGRQLRTFGGHHSSILPAVYDSRGRFVATGDSGGIIKIWDPRTGDELASLERHKGATVTGLTFSPDGRRLASAGADKQLVLWDTTTWQAVRTWAGHGQGLNGVAYAPDSLRVAVAQTDGTVVVRDERRDQAVCTLAAHNGRAMGLAFSADGRRLVTGGWDMAVRFWDLETGQPLLTLSGGQSTALLFDPAGRRLAALSPAGVATWFTAGRPEDAGPTPARRLDWYRRQVGDCEKAKQWFAEGFYCSRLLEADPAREAAYRETRAWAEYQQDDWQRMAADLTRALELEKPTANVLNLRGQAYFGLGQYERSEADQTRAIDLDPKYRNAWAHRGEARSRLGRWADAVADYTEALKLQDSGAATWRLRGAARAELGEWDQAVADFKEAVERAPTGTRELSSLAVAHLGRGDLAAYRRACVSMSERLGPTDRPGNWNSLSWVCSLAAGDTVEPDRLVRLMDRAVKAEPNTYAFLNTRGAVLYRAGRFQDAIDQLQEAVKLQGAGGAFEDWVFLALARSRLGQAGQAREALKRALVLYDEGLQPTQPGRRPADWSTRVEWRQLRKEAEQLLPKAEP